MLLNEAFERRKYKNILKNIKEFKEIFNLDFFCDEDIPSELLGMYLSQNWDELFLVLNSEGKDINELCEKWDKKISTFMVFGSKDKEILKKMKYNVVQIILFEDGDVDRTKEGSLNISRKIILPCTFGNGGEVSVTDDVAMELPFVLVTANETQKESGVYNELLKLLPEEGSNMEFLNFYREKRRKKPTEEEYINTFFDEFEMIKEWLLNNDNTEN